MTRRATPPALRWLLPVMTLGLILGVMLGRGAESWLPPLAALSASLLAACLFPGRRRVLALILAFAALGTLVTWHANHPDLPAEGEYVVSGVVLDELLSADDPGRIVTRLGDVTLNGTPLSGDAWWTSYLNADETLPDWLSPGLRVAFIAEAYHPQGRSNPNGYDFRESLLQDGIILGLYGHDGLQPAAEPAGLQGRLAALRHRLTMEMMRVMGDEAGALAAAMLLGTKEYLPGEDYLAFKGLGILHILSVSGFHVGVLALLLGGLLAPLGLPRKVRAGVLGVVLILYAILTGANPPVIRAGLLLMLREAGKIRQHRNLPLHLLCLAAACQLLFNPMQLFGASFQLTYGAMLGLLLVYPRLRGAFVSTRPWVSWLWKGLAASIAVQLGLLPAQMYWFGSFTPVALVLNIFVTALASFVMALYWLALALLPVPLVREAFGAATGLMTRWMLAVIRFLAEVLGHSVRTPSANVLTVIGWALLLLGLSVLLKPRRALLRRMLALCGACMIALSCVRLPNTGTYWLQLSDGEADAGLLHDKNAVILVDAGENAFTAADYLQSRCLSVDMLILTHLHIDHAGGIAGLVNGNIPVRTCALPDGALTAGDLDEEVLILLRQLAETGTEFVTLSRGDVITTPSGMLTVLWPQAGTVRPGQSANDTCLALRADILGTSMLLAADLTSRYEMYAAVPADILKAAHHGSGESTSPAFLEAVGPQAILLSCGTENREAAFIPCAGDIPVYSTHSSGGITVRFTENAFTVETFLPR